MKRELDDYITGHGGEDQLREPSRCSCGSTKIHDHKRKFTKYIGRHYWEAERASGPDRARWDGRARSAGFKGLTDALRAARSIRPERPKSASSGGKA